MKNKVLIAPSILSADFARLGDDVAEVSKAGADLIHVDVMDGVFVPNITMGPGIVKAIRGRSKKPFDVHLMIQDPAKYVGGFAEAGADIITFHIEAEKNPGKIIRAIRERGLKAGISVKPKTPVSSIKKYLTMVDMVLIMTVEPGFGGQSFMKDMVVKIEELRKIFKGDIEVDGGINYNTAKSVIKAGADILVAGTAVFGEKNYKYAIRRLKGE